MEDEDESAESEDEDELQDKQQLQEKLQSICKCGEDHEDEYIKFIAKFGPAMVGVSYWNNNKDKLVLLSKLLTVTNEAFIHLCMINYSKTWKAQEKRKNGEDEQV